jgi:hypothetical protein
MRVRRSQGVLTWGEMRGLRLRVEVAAVSVDWFAQGGGRFGHEGKTAVKAPLTIVPNRPVTKL